MQFANNNRNIKQLTASVTQRGQVTIPVEVQRILGIRPREKVAFAIEGKEVRLTSAAFTLESAYGSIKHIHKPENFKEIIRSVKEEKAKRTMQKLYRV